MSGTTPLARPADDEHYGPAARQVAFERGTDGPRMIMVGVDGSDSSLHAAASALGTARRQGCCRLTVVFVAAPSVLSALSAEALAAQERTFEELVAEMRDEIRRAAEEYALPITFITRRGDPYTELRAIADEIKADMVFVGASAHAGHRFIGSIATRLVRLGRWPVVVVP